MALMALKSLRALATAIADVKKEAGDSAEHKELLSCLAAVSKELGSDAADAPKDRDSDDDEYSFAAAEKRHIKRNSKRSADDTSGAGDAK